MMHYNHCVSPSVRSIWFPHIPSGTGYWLIYVHHGSWTLQSVNCGIILRCTPFFLFCFFVSNLSAWNFCAYHIVPDSPEHFLLANTKNGCRWKPGLKFRPITPSRSCADPEAGTRGPEPLPGKSQSYRVPYQYWSGSHGKSTKLSSQHSMLGQSIGLPAKRHLMAFRWRADGGPLIVVLRFSHQQKKRCQSWTPSDKTFWVRVWNGDVGGDPDKI